MGIQTVKGFGQERGGVAGVHGDDARADGPEHPPGAARRRTLDAGRRAVRRGDGAGPGLRRLALPQGADGRGDARHVPIAERRLRVRPHRPVPHGARPHRPRPGGAGAHLPDARHGEPHRRQARRPADAEDRGAGADGGRVVRVRAGPAGAEGDRARRAPRPDGGPGRLLGEREDDDHRAAAAELRPDGRAADRRWAGPARRADRVVPPPGGRRRAGERAFQHHGAREPALRPPRRDGRGGRGRGARGVDPRGDPRAWPTATTRRSARTA